MVRRELGRESLAHGSALPQLAAMWQAMAGLPEAALKRALWEGQLRGAYGGEIGDDRLFLQHSHLTNLAKTISARVLDVAADDPCEKRHQALAAAGAEAERLVATVDLSAAGHFTRTRKAIRAALAEAGIAARIDDLVAALLDRPGR